MGGTLRYVIDQEIRCFDPQQETALASLTVLSHTVDTLVVQDPETGEILPHLASSFEVNEDATVFTFELRDDVTFSDGSRLDAEDVRRTFESVTELGARAPRPASYVAGLVSVEVDGERSVTISFDRPVAHFLQAASTDALGILSAASFDNTPEERCEGRWSGSGPFVLESLDRTERVVIVRRTGYAWGSPLSTTPGEAYLDSIEFRIVLEPGVRTGLLQSGQADVIAGVFPEDERNFETADYWMLSRAAPGFTNSLIVNLQRPFMADEAVRRALLVSIDRQELVDLALSPRSNSATGLLSSATPFHRDFSHLFATDIDEANRLLDEAGWARGADGFRQKDGERLRLRVVFFLGQTPLMEVLQQQFAEIGVELELRGFTPPERGDIEAAADFDFIQRNLTRPDPDVLANQLAVAFANYLQRDEPDDLDALLQAQAAAGDPSARQAIVDEIQEYLLGRAYVLPLSEQTLVFAGRAQVHGVYLDTETRPVFTNAWIER